MATKEAHNVDERIRALLDEFERSESFHVEVVKLALTEAIYDLMQQAGMTKAALAEAIQVTRSYVTKMLRGDVNFTIATLVKVANALNCALDVSNLFVSKQARERTWPKGLFPIPKDIVRPANPTDNIPMPNVEATTSIYRSAA